MAVKKTQMFRKNLDTSETNLYPLTEAQYVSMDNGQTVQEVLSDRDSDKYTPVITNSSSTFKVGQGDNVDLSSSMKEGAYDSCVLKGKTMVNCIQEPSSKDVVLPYEFEEGQYVTINDTKESGALGAELKGQTLVNLVVGGNEQKQVGQANNTLAKYNFTYQLDHTKTYTLYFEVSGFTGVNYFNISASGGNNGGAGTVNQDGKYKIKISPHSSNSEKMTGLWFYWETPRWADGNRAFVQNIVLLEGDYTNVDLPYFTGMTSCKMPILSTVGKNLFNYKNYNLKVNKGQNPQEIIVDEQGLSFNVDTASWKSLWYDLYLESGEKYTLSYNTNLLRCFIFKSKVDTYVSSELVANTTVANATEDKIQKVTKTFTAPSTGFIRVRLVSEQKVGNHILQNFQIEKSSSVTTYEPHKSSILQLPEEVVLRSLPNGVCDTFNTRTGVYTQRVGEVVLNGSEDWFSGKNASWYSDGNTMGFYFDNFTLAQGTSLHVDKFLSNPNIALNDMEGCYINTQWSWVGVRIYKTKLPSLTVDAFKQWLTQNPITIQYELTEPIITKINLSSTLKSWNTTTHIYSEIPENTLYPILSHANPTYPVILKPSTKYSIVANSYSNGHTNSAINFNLGGATASTTVGNRVTTITTPSTLSNESLTMSGRGNKLNNVMVIEGDVVGDEPHFEGICDCKSPILSNVGKNLFDKTKVKREKYQNYNVENGTFSISSNSNYKVTDYIRVKPNASYTGRNLGDGAYYTFNKKPITDIICRAGNFTVPSNAHYVVLNMSIGQDEDAVRLEEVPSSSLHENYKSNTTTFEQKDGKTIVLRSLPNGVCDTLNVETGEYVQRIGEVVLDGSENWAFYGATGEGVTTAFKLSLTGHISAWTGGIGHCDRLKFVSGDYIYSTNNEGITTDANNFVIRVLNEKASTIEELKSYLKTKPLTVQYELATPIVSTIDIQGFPYAYKDGHVQLSSGSIEQSLTPTVEYSLSANKTGQINSNTKRVSAHQKQLDDFEAMMLTAMVDSAYDKAILQFDYEMQMMSLGGE